MIEQFKVGSVTFTKLDDYTETIIVEEGSEEAERLADEAARTIEAAGLDKAEKVKEQAEIWGGDLVFSESKGYGIDEVPGGKWLQVMYAGWTAEGLAFGILEGETLKEALYSVK